MTIDERPSPTQPALGIETASRAVRTAARAAGAGVYLGTGPGGWAWAGPERSTLVLGPSRSGKTSSLVIPNVLAAPGAVVSTSTKPDVLEATGSSRAVDGWALLYDPSGTVAAPPGVTRVGWSPVTAAGAWEGALLTADAMVRTAGSAAGAATTGGDHWGERARALLAPLLHAAALDGRRMSSVLSWVDRHEGSAALDILLGRLGERAVATDLLAGILSTDGREQSGIWSTTSGALSAYRAPAALSSTEPPFLDADAFCAGANALYICAPSRLQEQLAPLVVGVLSDVRDAAYARALHHDDVPPVLLALDEVANIAPIPDLPAMVSEGAGQGLLTLACLQDLSQARHRWGPRADAFLSLFGTTVVLGGIADLRTLEALSALAGEVELPTRSVGATRGHDGRLQPSTSTATIWRRRLSVDQIGRGRPGSALAVDAANRFGWIGLTPAHRTGPWRELLDHDRHRPPAVRSLGDDGSRRSSPSPVFGEVADLSDRPGTRPRSSVIERHPGEPERSRPHRWPARTIRCRTSRKWTSCRAPMAVGS